MLYYGYHTMDDQQRPRGKHFLHGPIGESVEEVLSFIVSRLTDGCIVTALPEKLQCSCRKGE